MLVARRREGTKIFSVARRNLESEWKTEASRVLLFLVAGAINLLATYGLFLGALFLLSLHYLLANLFAFLAWSWFGYEIQRRWVFRKSTSMAAFFRYLINQVTFFGASTLLLLFAVEVANVTPELAYLIVVGVVAIGMYLSSIFFVFRNSPPT